MAQEMQKSSSSRRRGGAGGLPPTPTPSVAASPDYHATLTADILSQMSEFPNRNNIRHRRVHSEIVILPEPGDILSRDVVTDAAGGNTSSLSDDSDEEDLVSMFNFDQFPSSAAYSSSAAPPVAAVMSSLASAESKQLSRLNDASPRTSCANTARARWTRHHHGVSLDGSSSANPDGSLVPPAVPHPLPKRAMPPAELAQLALVDPKRARRIIANRQSAARSKQRRQRYIAELEQKERDSRAEMITLTAKLAMVQRGNNSVVAQNNDMRLRLEDMERNRDLQDALNARLEEEIRRLRFITGETLPNRQSYAPVLPNRTNFLAAHQLQNQSWQQQKRRLQLLLQQQQQQDQLRLQQLQQHQQQQEQLRLQQLQQQQQQQERQRLQVLQQHQQQQEQQHLQLLQQQQRLLEQQRLQQLEEQQQRDMSVSSPTETDIWTSYMESSSSEEDDE